MAAARAAAQAGGYAPSDFRLWSSFVETLRDWARAEAGAGRLLPWVPVAFGTGIAFYFAADHEPVLSVAAVAAIGLCAAAFLMRRHKAFPAAVMLAAAAAGFAIATWKTARVAHGVLAQPIYSVALTGFVETRDIRERTDRFVLRVATMESPRGEHQAGAGAAVGEEGHRARRRQLRRTEGAAAAADRPVTARQLRFRPRHVFSAHRRLRLRDGLDQGGRSARRRRHRACAIPRSCRACATPSTRASATCSRATSARLRPRC